MVSLSAASSQSTALRHRRSSNGNGVVQCHRRTTDYTITTCRDGSTHTTTIMKYTQKELVGKVTLLLIPPLQQLHHHLTRWTRSAEQQ